MRWKEIEQLHESVLEEGILDKTKFYIAAAALGFGTLGANIADKITDIGTEQSQVQHVDTTSEYFLKSLEKKSQQPQVSRDDEHHPNYPKELLDKEGKELKQTFKTIIMPMIEQNNQRILQKRKKIISLKNKKTLTVDEQEWLDMMYERYRVPEKNIDNLLTKVDIVPVEIAISQAALESGYGTSRFAKKANALFGQKTTAAKAIHSETDRYAVFPHFKDSIESYMRNINSHPAYEDFRQLRKKTKDPKALLAGLKKYSTLGKGYIKKLKQVMSSL